jgi:ornithine cyclodeaminase/alanine dehydrogenase-like protein (mu-crystallin family)
MAEAIEAMRSGFQLLSQGEASVPLRTFLPLTGYGGSALFMPAYAESEKAYAVKVASIHKNNAQRGVEAVQAVVLVFDAETGRVDAILEGKSVTALRTGAGSGLATDLLARPDARVAAVFGSGTQARSHVEAVCAVRPIERVYCIGRSGERAEVFAAEMRGMHDIDVQSTDRIEVCAEADVIGTTTTAKEPILHRSDVSAGTHINAVGTHRPGDAEIAADLVASARVVVDDMGACLAEAGDLLRPLNEGVIDREHIFAEIGEIAAGLKPGRVDADEITLFKSVGVAIQDLAAATRAVSNARRLGIGRPVNL